MTSGTSKCLNCNEVLHGKFCSSCGQKVIEPQERTVKHFIYQFFGAAFFLENNFLKNLWSLVTKPGKLPLDFIDGRTKRWMPPFSLFFLINLFYFWYSPLSDFNLKLGEQLNQFQHKRLVNYMVDKKIESEGLSMEQYANTYNAKSKSYANTLIIINIPIFAGILMLFFLTKEYFYVDHLVYALYFLAFLLLVTLIQSTLYFILVIFELSFSETQFKVTSIGVLALMIWYIFKSLKTTYCLTTARSAAIVLPICLAFIISHLLYRTILFLIIFSLT